jgi:SulP family sulfate permease
MPSGGSLSRTAVNVSAGARTRLANILAGVYITIILLTLGPLIERVALTALAALLFVAAASLIRVDEIRMVLRVSPGWPKLPNGKPPSP